jgi:hypothetical protein
MQLIPTNKEPGAFIHLTSHELSVLQGLLDTAPPRHWSTPFSEKDQETLTALRNKIARYLREAAK